MAPRATGATRATDTTTDTPTRSSSSPGPRPVAPRLEPGSSVRLRVLVAGLLALAAGVASPSRAEAVPVDGYVGLLMAGGRPAGMAGAYVGLGEGIAGEPFNPAAVAQRYHRLERRWDWDGTITWYVPSARDLTGVDLDNDGWNDGGLDGFANLTGGLSGQVGRFGAGLVLQALHFDQGRVDRSTQRVGLSTATLSLGWSGWRDALVIGGGLAVRVGTYEVVPPGGSGAQQLASYEAVTWRMGALLRPRGERWRLGVALQTGKTTGVSKVTGAVPAGAPTAFDFPWQLSVGLSAWVGPNAARFNEPAPVSLAEHPEWGPGPGWEPSARAPLVLSLQLDVIGPSPGAISLTSALTGGAVPSGRRASLVPRAGAEWDAVPDRFRVRGGSYLEGSRTGAPPRLHATLGLELRVPFWPWDLQLSGGVDLADRFQDFSISIGFWNDLTPAPPPVAIPPPVG